MSQLNLLYQGAEAKIFLDKEQNSIIKDRIKKSYRIPELDDKIRKQRTKSEKKLLEKSCKIINAPNPFPLKEFNRIRMPFIDGEKLSEHLDSFPLEKQRQILKIVGQETAKLHSTDIIHGDLTTSNLILVENINQPAIKKRGDNDSKNFHIFFVDFGLGYISRKIEDKAVDIHLLKQALEARHFRNWKELFDAFLKGYDQCREYSKILERLRSVERRGRYRH